MKFHSAFILSLTLSSLSLAQFVFAGSATWSANPANGDWNTPTNWTPATVPNGPSDRSFFAASSKTAVSLSAPVEVNTITFDSAASSYTVTAPAKTLTLSGAGVINNSAVIQNFVADGSGEIDFTNNATAGANDSLSNNGGATSTIPGGKTNFFNSSTAGSAIITNNGGPQNGFTSNGTTNFFDNATADQAAVTNNPGAASYGGGGTTNFADFSSAGDAVFANKTGTSVYSGTVSFANNATAGNASFTNDGGNSGSFTYAMVTFGDSASAANATFENGGGIGELGYPGYLVFFGSATAENATITNDGSLGAEALGGVVSFNDEASASNSTITLNGGLVFAGAGGSAQFSNTSTAADSTLIANNAGDPQADGGHIFFFDDSTGGAARVEVFGSGTLEISYHNAPGVTIGSLEGDGAVSLGSNELTVGGNNLDTVFSGVIQDESSDTGGSVSKGGKGKLTLTSPNTYRGGTTVIRGALLVTNRSGSALGRGKVHVNAGILAGTGQISGAVTLGTGTGVGAVLSPGKSVSKPGTLTVKNTLTFSSDSTYKCALDRVAMKATQVAAGGVKINGAQFVFADLRSGALTTGEVFTVVNNTSASPIIGRFTNLADGSTFTSTGGTTFLVSYEGGTGNDLTLTVQ
ncbi:MAG: hypothetical protein H0X34_10405 [Chthoniobacterales bacterium]|nr:hypothetical protein [Chthoniobacterales bacterium]